LAMTCARESVTGALVANVTAGVPVLVLW